MREYTKKPENQSRTLDSNPRASRQAPISEILQAYKNGNWGRQSIIQRESVEDEELLQTKRSGQATANVILQRYKESIQRYAPEEEDLLQSKFDTTQREEIDEDKLLQGKFEPTPTAEQELVQREEKPNNTGLPDNLKTGIENLSGYSMDDVKVHYNSDKPAQLSALAYAQGTDIHVGPGQEKHLPHEAWHVVQQKQGRVQPTMQLQGVNVNDNEGLEKEADIIQQKQGKPTSGSDDIPINENLSLETKTTTVQFVDWQEMTSGVEREILGLDILHPKAITEKKWGKIEDKRLLSDKVLWFITRDMSGSSTLCNDADEGTLEMVSTPAISIDDGISNRNNAFEVYINHLKRNAKTRTQLQEISGNDETKPLASFSIPIETTIKSEEIGDHYKVEPLCKEPHAIIKREGTLTSSDQLTVGVTFDQLFTILNIPWLNKTYIEDTKVNEILGVNSITGDKAMLYKRIFSYVASVSEKEAEIYMRFIFDIKSPPEMDDPAPKNAWKLLPRTSKTEVLDLISEASVKSAIEQQLQDRDPMFSDWAKKSDFMEKNKARYKEYYNTHCLTNIDAGQYPTTDTIKGEKMYLLEYRQPRTTEPFPVNGLKDKWFSKTTF